jgi:hypothetical protein
MNCLLKRQQREAEAADLEAIKEKEELQELTILLEGRNVAEDYRS